MGKNGKKTLKSDLKGIEREALRREYITSEYEYVKDYLATIFTPRVALSGTVKEKTKGRHQDRADYWEDYYRTFTISPETKRRYTKELNRVARVHSRYLGAIVDLLEDKLEVDPKTGKLKDPKGISLNELITISNIVQPLYTKSNDDDDSGKRALDYLAEIKKAVERTNATRANHAKQKQGGAKPS